MGEIPLPGGSPLPCGDGSIPVEVIPVPNPVIVRFEGGKPMEVVDPDSPKQTKREFTIIVTPIKHCKWKDNINVDEIEASNTQAHFSKGNKTKRFLIPPPSMKIPFLAILTPIKSGVDKIKRSWDVSPKDSWARGLGWLKLTTRFWERRVELVM